ncbi:MAG: DUF2723 domain-containing protein [Bacteroidaceae bacterium]|nr:DUF2723 domain-containing protein [Bacteroidaceae bacterium]
MKRYNIINNVTGWLTFLVAAFTYCSTVEPTASFWDCPEFITTAFKLEVGHPPGAPFFMLTGNLFSQFTSDPTKVALMVNIMSALLSAFCILFLFWSVTHLARKLLVKDGADITLAQTILIMGCGLTGALAYTWSDTFWFSAVEGEVYAYSSMFTALVFWLILKWEDHADEPGSDRWLVLIFYLTGLSIGVHLLNLLCLPAICLVYYYKKTPQANLRGSLMALAISFVLVAAVLYGLVPGIVKVGGWFELACVNGMGMPFNSGMVIYLIVLVATVLSAIWATTRSNRQLIIGLYVASVGLLGVPFIGHGTGSIVLGVLIMAALVGLLLIKRGGQYLIRKRFLNTSLLCMLVLMIGYSSYALILIRSAQNTPMDQNSPEDIFTLGSYLNREQYGTAPLVYGEAFTSRPIDISKEEHIQRHEKTEAGEKDRYDVVSLNGHYVYADAEKMLFPRMHSGDPRHVQAYKDWLGGVETHPVSFFVTRDGREEGPYEGEMPSQWDNLRFFMSYQINFMYWRYFMWNFAGRQNDLQGNGELEHGNWITGIAPIDNLLLCDQAKLPDELRENKGHNVFYCLPLLLGLLGLFWQAYKGQRGVQQFWVTFFLFFMTGLAIVLYLNQTPMQPRERDYAYAGSFYAFCIWIGLGVAAIAQAVEKYCKQRPLVAACVATLLGVLVPLQMVSQTWDDHDRSGRYTCRDFGANYLNSLPAEGNPIIFTNGDNDTFPLWYGQEVEGTRTDARVCNLSYLQTDWYTDQMRRPAYDSPALPITWKRAEYVDNMGHDIFHVKDYKEDLLKLKAQIHEDPFELQYVIDNFVRNPEFGFIPSDSLVLTIDKDAVRRSGMRIPEGDSIPDKMHISLRGKQRLSKSEMMVYEMLAHHNWVRPMFMSITLGQENEANLTGNLQLEGLARRVTPFVQPEGACDADRMYDNMMTRFRYGNLKQRGLYLDETTLRMCYTHRAMFVTLAKQLLLEGKRDKALKALQKCEQEIPSYNVRYEFNSIGYDYETGLFDMPEIFHQLGHDRESEAILLQVAENARQYLGWYNSLPWHQACTYGRNSERYYIFLSSAIEGLKRCKSSRAQEYDKFLMGIEQTQVGQILAQRLAARQ